MIGELGVGGGEGYSLGAEGISKMHCSMKAKGTFSKKPRLISAPAPICILKGGVHTLSPLSKHAGGMRGAGGGGLESTGCVSGQHWRCY